MMTRYFSPEGGLPPQTALHTGRAVFTEAYALIPRGVFSDIVTSLLPGWNKTRLWIIARPMTGFSETFSHYVMEVGAGGGSTTPEPDALAEGALFVTSGAIALTIAGSRHNLVAGGFAYLPAGCAWTLSNDSVEPARFHWIRKRWEPAAGLAKPPAFVTSDQAVAPNPMPDTNNTWATTRFMDPADLAHDMHVTLVTFQPGGSIPFEETHVMEHGLYVLEGKAVYRLNRDWVEVEAGDYMWLRAFCPQACYAGGPGPFRYLLYKDVNRHAALGGVFGAGR
jgi:(S)-ureidoglycine aminohydrolase